MTKERPFARLTDAELDAAINRAERAVDQHRFSRNLPFRQDAHRGIDASVVAAADIVRTTLAQTLFDTTRAAQLPVIPDIANAWVLSRDPEVARLWHQAVDESSDEGWHSSDRPAFEATMTTLRGEVMALQGEQRLRRLEVAKRKLELEVAALEAASAD